MYLVGNKNVSNGGTMIEVKLKQILKPTELINNLKLKNIKFNEITEYESINYLKYYGNYHLIKSYEQNFFKYPSPAGKYEGLYIDLDFAYLIDLFEIDYEVRIILLKVKK